MEQFCSLQHALSTQPFSFIIKLLGGPVPSITIGVEKFFLFLIAPSESYGRCGFLYLTCFVIEVTFPISIDMP